MFHILVAAPLIRNQDFVTTSPLWETWEAASCVSVTRTWTCLLSGAALPPTGRTAAEPLPWSCPASSPAEEDGVVMGSSSAGSGEAVSNYSPDDSSERGTFSSELQQFVSLYINVCDITNLI